MPTRAVATSTLWQLASQCVMAALSILTVKFIALGLTKELAGGYNTSYGYLQLFGVLADFGLYAVAIREVSHARDRGEVLGGMIILRCVTITLSLGMALLLAWTIPQWRGTPLPLGITIAALVPLFTLIAGTVRTIFQVTHTMHLVFIAEVTQRVVTTVLMGLFILLGIRGSGDLHVFHLFLFIGGIGAFILFLLSMVFSTRFVTVPLRLDPKLLQRLLRTAIPFGLAFLFMAVARQFDITLIALLRPDFELQNAYYGFVMRMTEMGFILPTFLLNSVFPLLSRKYAGGEELSGTLGKTILSILLIGSIAALTAVFWARPLTQLLTTDAYLSTPQRPGSDTALLFMGIPLFLNGLILYSFYVLLLEHRWRALMLALAAGAFLSLALSIALIPFYGFLGAVASSIATHLFLCGTLFPLSIRLHPFSLPRRGFRLLVVFAFLLSVALFSLRFFLETPTATMGGLALLALLIFVLGELTGLRKLLME